MTHSTTLRVILSDGSTLLTIVLNLSKDELEGAEG